MTITNRLKFEGLVCALLKENMVYQNKVVAVVKVNGKVLKEQNGQVYIPFGSEYSILIKNLDSVRIKVRVDIDGQNAVDWVIVNPNSSTELERFFHGNMNEGNRFKFIERTESIENYRGVKAEDGLIRVEYKREKLSDYNIFNTLAQPWPLTWKNEPLITYTSGSSVGRGLGNIQSSMNCNLATTKCAEPSDTGITVEGNISNQQFQYVSGFDTESHSEVIVISLKGKVEGKVVSQPVTVKYRPRCKTCGMFVVSTFSKFCGNCGTSLQIV